MTAWTVTYWDGSQLRKTTLVCGDMYSLSSAISSSPAGQYMYNIISIVREPM